MGITLEPQGNDTHLSLDMSYQMPGGALGRAVNSVLLERMNEKTAERMLENIKLIVETEGTDLGTGS